MERNSSTSEINNSALRRGASKHQQRYSHEAHKIGPYSRPHHFAKVDGRTRAAALLRRVRRELTEFVGPNPTVTQRMMIDRAVILSLRLAQLDRKIVAEEHFTILDNNQYLAWSNSLSRLLDKLGRNTGKRTSAPLNAVLAELAYDTSQ